MLTFAPYQLHEGSTLPTSSLATTNGKPGWPYQRHEGTLPTSSLATTNGKPGWPYQRHEGTLPTSSLATTNGKPESPPPPQKRPPPAPSRIYFTLNSCLYEQGDNFIIMLLRPIGWGCRMAFFLFCFISLGLSLTCSVNPIGQYTLSRERDGDGVLSNSDADAFGGMSI